MRSICRILGQNPTLLLAAVVFIMGCSDTATPDDNEKDTVIEGCQSDLDCDDNNPCTVGICAVNGACLFDPRVGESCENADACTTESICDSNGGCVGQSVELPDIPCQNCSCDPETGVACALSDEGTPCDDGNCCTEEDICTLCAEGDENCPETGRNCVGTALGCFDDDVCTQDVCACDEKDDVTCGHPPVPDGLPCDDSENDCTVGDACLGGHCIVGAPLPLDDENPCTWDYCEKGEVKHVPLMEGSCIDDNECTKDDYCFQGTCVGGPPVECTVPLCANSASCITGLGCQEEWMPEGAQCDDGNPCTYGDQCDLNHECTTDGEQNCDDLNPCTDDTCDANTGCVHTFNTLPCDDDDPCTAEDACQEGSCEGSGGAGDNISVNCTQNNAVDSDGCCCFKPDPTGQYASGHVIDFGMVYGGVEVECCMATGFNDGCTTETHFDASIDGEAWSFELSFPMSSVEKEGGGWEQTCQSFSPAGPFRYIRGGVNNCYADYFQCSIECGAQPAGCGEELIDCDDGNPCTLNSCDEVTGTCTTEPLDDPSCLTLAEGNNLVSFGILPDNPGLDTVLGVAAPYAIYVIGESRFAKRMSDGQWAGNLVQFERTDGYWVGLDLPTGQTSITIHLEGEPTDPDIRYPLHEGINSISFAGVTPTLVSDALPDDVEAFFSIFVGQGVAAIPGGSGWIGSLTKLSLNHGYEVSVTQDINPFQFFCAECDGVAPYSYGCTDGHAMNYSASADVDDGSCIFPVPAGWELPYWGLQKQQGFIFFHDLQINGESLAPDDVVGVFAGEKSLGFGFSDGLYTIVPAMNGTLGDILTFRIYDASENALVDLTVTPAMEWGLNMAPVVGCTDEGALNYNPDATYTAGNCVYP